MQNWRKLLGNNKIIPVVVIDNAAHAVPLAEAILQGGINVIEITLRTEAALESIQCIRQALPEMLVGAGTLVTAQQAQQALQAGVHFGLAPGLNPATVDAFKQAGTLFIPGVITPSEIQQALSLGCELLKFFPAQQAGGVSMLRSLSAAYQHLGVHFCPTGGINLDNMPDYLQLPSVAAIGGSWLATQQQIADQQWSLIAQQVKQSCYSSQLVFHNC